MAYTFFTCPENQDCHVRTKAIEDELARQKGKRIEQIRHILGDSGSQQKAALAIARTEPSLPTSLNVAELPSTPPERWKDRKNKDESAVMFIKRVYGPWLGKGLTRANLFDIDKPLYVALNNQIQRSSKPDSTAENLDLPTKGEQAQKWINLLTNEGAKVDLSNPDVTKRLLSVLQWHAKKFLSNKKND